MVQPDGFQSIQIVLQVGLPLALQPMIQVVLQS